MEKKLWYAVMIDNEDTDHGYGCFDKKIAIRTAKQMRSLGYSDGYVAVVDPEDDFCIGEIRDFDEE